MLSVAAESETAKIAKCPSCREPLDVDILVKQRPKINNNSSGQNQQQQHDKQRPPRRSHASKSSLSELVINDGHNVAIRGIPSELFALFSTTSRSTQPQASSSSSSSSSSPLSLQELVCSQSWLGQYGRIMSCCVSQAAGAVVLRFFNAEDAQSLVSSMNSTNNINSIKNTPRVFVASLLEEDEDAENADASEEKRKISSRPTKTTKKDLVLSCCPHLKAALVPTRYCSSFLRNEECKKPFCVEIHQHTAALQKNVLKGQRASEISIFGNFSNIADVRGNNHHQEMNDPSIIGNEGAKNNDELDQQETANHNKDSSSSSIITTTDDGINYYTSPRDWSQDLITSMKCNFAQYFAAGPFVQSSLERKVRSTFDAAFQALNITSRAASGGSRGLSFHQKKALSQLPLVFPILPPAAKEVL